MKFNTIQLPQEKLVVGQTYIGRGRNGNIGKWTGKAFLVIGEKFGEPRIKIEPYYTEDRGCFQPFLAIDEGEMIEPFGKSGWNAHYGCTMIFNNNIQID